MGTAIALPLDALPLSSAYLGRVSSADMDRGSLDVKVREPAAEAFYRRIPGRTGLPQNAIVAVARKLAVTLWRLMVAPVTGG